MPLPEAFFARPAEQVARDLLGARLVPTLGCVRCAVRLVETEAYTGPEDEASHAAARIGRTPRNDPMFGPPGRAYVYRIYGLHRCLNVVTGPEGFPAAVLLRAGVPVEGLEAMRQRRGPVPPERLALGPANLARALGIDLALNRHPLDRPPLWLEADAPVPEACVRRTPRIGVSRAREALLRFVVAPDCGGLPVRLR